MLISGNNVLIRFKSQAVKYQLSVDLNRWTQSWNCKQGHLSCEPSGQST